MESHAGSLFLLMFLAVMCAACASPSSPEILPMAVKSPASSAPQSIAPTVFYGGEEGATCMANVLKSRMPSSDPRVSTFQDFDVVYSVLEFMSDAKPFRLDVVSAANWKSSNKVNPIVGSVWARLYQQNYTYYFNAPGIWPVISLTAIGSAMNAIVQEWEQACHAGEAEVLFRTGVP